MKQLWRRLSADSLERKINYFLFLGILIPFVLAGMIYAWFSSRQVENILTQNTGQLLSQVDMMLDFYTSSIENIMGVVEGTASTVDFLGVHGGTLSRNQQAQLDQLEQYLDLIQDRYPEVAGVLILNKHDVYVSSQINRRSRDSLLQESWYRRALEEPESYILLSKPLGRNLTSLSGYSDDQIMSIVKAVRNPRTNNYEGVILLDFHLSAFEENIRNITVGSKGFVYVTDSEGDIIYAPSNPIIHRIDNRFVLDNPRERTVANIGGEYYQVVCEQSPGWNVMGVFHMSDIRAPVYQLWYTTIALLVCTTVLMQLFSRQLDRMLIRPLKELQTLMTSAENGHIDVQFAVKTQDEIGSLGNSFNRMLGEIQKLLTIIDQENELKRKAEFHVLQEQIKPHFLYNTLDTINWIAMESGQDEIVRIVMALTRFFRLSLNKGKEYTTVTGELEQVKNYLIIQDIRYERAFSYHFEIDPSIERLYVLKLILQPLVENSIYHGVKEKEGFGRIEIRGRRRDGQVEFTVTDDGMGMPPERVEEINEMFRSGVHTAGFGLFNVHRRLKYAFGANCGLEVRSTFGQGTQVIIRHPVLKEEPHEAADR